MAGVFLWHYGAKYRVQELASRCKEIEENGKSQKSILH